MDKFFKHFGINVKRHPSEQVYNSSIPQEFNETREQYCGWSALIDFPLRYAGRRNSEVAHRLASHDLDCTKPFNAKPDLSNQNYSNHIYSNSRRSRGSRARNSICFDSRPPKLLDFYSDPMDMVVERTDGERVSKLTRDVFSEDEDYTVPYQPGISQKYLTFGSEKDLHFSSLKDLNNGHQKVTSSSHLCLSKYKIVECSDTYEEPWDLNFTKRNLADKLQATFSSNPTLQPVTIEVDPSKTKRTIEKFMTPMVSEKCACKMLRVDQLNGEQEESYNSESSCGSVPLNQPKNYRPSNPLLKPSNKVCHCGQFGHRSTWQGEENFERECKQQDFSSWQPTSSCPLEGQSWYHGELSRFDAEILLEGRKVGSFLVRTSESSRKDFSLSLKSEGGLLHIKIVKENDRFVLGQFSQPFESIPSIIQFFTTNKLPVRGTHHILLSHPVHHELL